MQAIYCRRRNLGSLALRTALWSPWSHCGIVTKELTVVHAAAFRGVVEESFDAFMAHVSRFSVRSIDIPNTDAAIAWARSQVGKPYDWWGVVGIGLRRDWQRDDAWFCSEFLEESAARGGRARFIHDAFRVTPQNSWMVA